MLQLAFLLLSAINIVYANPFYSLECPEAPAIITDQLVVHLRNPGSTPDHFNLVYEGHAGRFKFGGDEPAVDCFEPAVYVTLSQPERLTCLLYRSLSINNLAGFAAISAHACTNMGNKMNRIMLAALDNHNADAAVLLCRAGFVGQLGVSGPMRTRHWNTAKWSIADMKKLTAEPEFQRLFGPSRLIMNSATDSAITIHNLALYGSQRDDLTDRIGMAISQLCDTDNVIISDLHKARILAFLRLNGCQFQPDDINILNQEWPGHVISLGVLRAVVA